MGAAIYGRNDKLLVPDRKQELSEEDLAAVADAAAYNSADNEHSIQSIRGTTRDTTMDF
jgi:hypothetical protein